MEKVLSSNLGQFITISNANLYRGQRKLKKISGVKYCVEFKHYAYNRNSIIYCNNVAMGIYWYLFDKLKLSHHCHVGINKKEIVRLLIECRNLF